MDKISKYDNINQSIQCRMLNIFNWLKMEANKEGSISMGQNLDLLKLNGQSDIFEQ